MGPTRSRKEARGGYLKNPLTDYGKCKKKAAYELEPDAIKVNLQEQIASPVRWFESVRRLISDGHTHFVEVGPRRVLTELMREINREVEIHHVEDPAILGNYLEKSAKQGPAETQVVSS
jgi:malonyl CoA-acyl carrier protein transacylase